MAGPVPGNDANREQDLLAVAAEIQRLLEASGYKPMAVTEVSKSLSMHSHMILLQHALGLVGAIEFHQKHFKITEVEGCLMVSPCGVPWLGPKFQPSACPFKPGNNSKLPSNAACGESASVCSSNSIGQSLPRGKAIEMMGDLAETEALQESLRDIARQLIVAPKRTLLVSELGSQIGQGTRTFLRNMKVRVAQLLQCFPSDFQLTGTGPATVASYRHLDVKQKFSPQPSVNELNSGRYYRLLKLGADATERYNKATAIAAREVQSRKGVLFVDCRSDAERSVSVIPNSISARQVSDADLAAPQLVVAYCCIGAQAAEWCHAHSEGMWGYKLRFLSGGIACWVHLGGPLVNTLHWQPTTQVHCWVRELAPFFPVAGSGYEVVLTEHAEPITCDVLKQPSQMRHVRLRNLAWEVRMRYWPSVFCIEAADLAQQLSVCDGRKYCIVDCRTPEERQVSTVNPRNCRVISADEFRREAMAYLEAYETIVTCCTIGGRSGVFCKRLVEELLEVYYPPARADELRRKIVNVLGGFASWCHNQGGLIDAMGQPTNKLHPWCQAFQDLFPLENLELVFDEFRPVPQDALSLIACKTACGEKTEEVPQRLLQICSILPPEVINDSLTRAMQSCTSYED